MIYKLTYNEYCGIFKIEKVRKDVKVMLNKLLKITITTLLGLGMVGCSAIPEENWDNLASESEKKTTLVQSQTIQVDGLPTIYVDVEESDGLTQRALEINIEKMKRSPTYLLKNCTSIYFASLSKINEIAIQAGSHREGNDVRGLAHSDTLSIGLACDDKIYEDDEIIVDADTGKKQTGKEINEDYNWTLLHELWHIYDLTHGNLSQTPDFLTFFSNAEQFGDGYGNTNSREFFAEIGTSYVGEPESVKEYNIDLYNYFESLPKD